MPFTHPQPLIGSAVGPPVAFNLRDVETEEERSELRGWAREFGKSEEERLAMLARGAEKKAFVANLKRSGRDKMIAAATALSDEALADQEKTLLDGLEEVHGVQEKLAAALASVQELQQLKKEGPSAFVALEPISACYFIKEFPSIPHPPDMQAAYGSFGALVEDKWNLCLGYLSPERVKSPAMIVYDISQRLHRPLTKQDENELHAFAFPEGAAVTLRLDNQDGHQLSGQGGKTFLAAAHPFASRVDVLVLIHDLIRQAMIHCQETLFVGLQRLEVVDAQTAVWHVSAYR